MVTFYPSWFYNHIFFFIPLAQIFNIVQFFISWRFSSASKLGIGDPGSGQIPTAGLRSCPRAILFMEEMMQHIPKGRHTFYYYIFFYLVVLGHEIVWSLLETGAGCEASGAFWIWLAPFRQNKHASAARTDASVTGYWRGQSISLSEAQSRFTTRTETKL